MWADVSSGVASGGQRGQFVSQKYGKGQNQYENFEEWGEQRTSRKGGENKRDREKHKDVNGKVLGEEAIYCIYKTTNNGRSLLYETCYTNIK